MMIVLCDDINSENKHISTRHYEIVFLNNRKKKVLSFPPFYNDNICVRFFPIMQFYCLQ